MGSAERQETNTKLLYSDKSPNQMTCKSNDLSKRRYEKQAMEERVRMAGTELSGPIINNHEDPYTKYIVHVPSRADDSREIQTIATEDNIAEMRQIVDNALAFKQTFSTIGEPNVCTTPFACSTPQTDPYKAPQIDCWLTRPTPPEHAMKRVS